MNRDEFLRQLRLSLQGNLEHEKITENLQWYENYILMQIRKGKDEAEVLDSLGDPRLLADSIIGSSLTEEIAFDEEWTEKKSFFERLKEKVFK